MKYLGRLGLFFCNVMFILIFTGMIFFSFTEFMEGQIDFFTFLIHAIVYIFIWRITRSRPVQYLLGKLFGWDPFAGIAREQRKFNAWYDTVAAQNAQKQRMRNEEAYRRYKAKDKAIWHEYQAKKQAGTYSGYQHANQAKKYWDDAR